MAHQPDAAAERSASQAGGGEQASLVRYLRTRLGLSQEQLARRLSVSFATVNRWERGHSRMSASALARFRALEASLSAIEPAPASRPPAFLTSFVGWDTQISALLSRLRGSRIVTVAGPAGTGKTRLAAQASRRLASSSQVAFVTLPDTTAAGAVAVAMAALQAGDDQGPAQPTASGVPGPDRGTDLTGALAEPLRLLVIDGAERAVDEVAGLVAALLADDDGLAILVTSRVPLGVPGEHLWPVPRLSCAPPGATVTEILDAETTTLFVDRARAVRPDFAVTSETADAVAGLCREFDGFPLGIEEAASWVGTLSVAQILERRRDLFSIAAAGGAQGDPGSLRAAVESSYAPLDDELKAVLAPLAFFAGSFDVDDARAMTGLAGSDLLGRLRWLTRTRWLIVSVEGSESSYQLPVTLRDFIMARSHSGQESELRARHARHFATLADGSKDGLAGPDRARWAVTLTRAAEDLDGALTWASDTAETEVGLRMSAALWWWWLTTGRVAAGRRWLAEFLAACDRLPDAVVAPAHNAAAALAAEDGDYLGAVRHAQLALDSFAVRDDHDGAAIAATALASAQRYLGQRTAARRNFEVALHHRRSLGERQGIASALNNLALVALDDEALGSARELLDEALAIKRQLGDPRAVAIGLANLSDVLIKLRSIELATSCLDEAATVATDLADGQLLATIACNRGDVAVVRGNLHEAVALYQLALDGYQSSGGPHDVIRVLLQLAEVQRALGRTTEAVTQLRLAEALAVAIGSEQRLADVRPALGELEQPVLSGWPGELTPRQVEILRHIALGASNAAIAGILHLSVSTVERHLANIYDKLGLSGRVEATRYALAHGLVPHGDASR